MGSGMVRCLGLSLEGVGFDCIHQRWYSCFTSSVTIFRDLLEFGQLFKAFGNY